MPDPNPSTREGLACQTNLCSIRCTTMITEDVLYIRALAVISKDGLQCRKVHIHSCTSVNGVGTLLYCSYIFLEACLQNSTLLTAVRDAKY